MGTMHGGRLVARALRAEQVPFIFTLCGGHVMPIYDGCVDEGIRVIDVRHEQTAAHAADGGTRHQVRRRVVTAARLTDAVIGVASAQCANIPDIIGGQAATLRRWAAAGHEPRRVCARSPMGICRRDGASSMSMAFRAATTGLPGPVFLEMPIDQLFDVYEEEQVRFPTRYRTEAGIAGDPQPLPSTKRWR
jgi:acetolactate synthase-1/2/3 large subunit